MNTLTLLFVLVVAVAIVAWLVLKFQARPRDRFPLDAPPDAPPAPPDPPLPLIELFVADLNGQQIVAFALDPNGSIPAQPTRAFGFNQPNSGLVNPYALVVNPAREIWVINRGALFLPPGDPPPVLPNVPSISAYAGNTQGNAVTFRHFDSFVPPAGDFRTLENPVAVGWRNGPPALLVADTVFGRVFEFTPTDPVPSGSISVGRPTGVCTDDVQRVYVSDQNPADPCVWRVTMHPGVPDQVPFEQIAGAATLLRNPGHLAIDIPQNLYVVNEGSEFFRGEILIFAPGALGNVAPVRRLFSTENSAVNWHHPRSVAVDSLGRVFVSANNRVMVFAAGADGNATPIQVLEPATFGDVYGLSVR